MNYRITKFTKTELFILICLIFLLIENAIPYYGNIIKYADEVISLFMIGALAYRYRRWLRCNESRNIILLLSGIVLLGLLCNALSEIISNVPAILIDAFGIVKNHLIFLALVFSIKRIRLQKMISFLIPFVKGLIIIVFICGVINCFHDIGMSYTRFAPRFGLKSYEFMYTNPSMVGITMIVCIAFLDAIHYKGILKYMALFSMLLTFRALVVAMIIIYFIIYFFIKFSGRIKLYHIVVLVLIAAIIGWEMVGKDYIINKESNRYLLMYYGTVVFRRFFPLGSGFATYGSQMAYNHYSPFYIEFGFLDHWGLNLVDGSTANDNFWPMIMAQFGLFGLFFMGGIMYFEYKIVINAVKDKQRKLGIMAIFFSLALSTFASADLTGMAGTIRYFWLGLLVAYSQQEEIFNLPSSTHTEDKKSLKLQKKTLDYMEG